MSATIDQEKTGLGNYFIANYPPFSAWSSSQIPNALQALNAKPKPDTPLGLYLHIPFCRKRCKFCYFRVYTDKNAKEIETYLDALVKEVQLLSRSAVIDNRPLHYVYFGGGTPSYLSAQQLRDLMTRLREIIPWDQAKEVTFECEPGTLQKHKLETLREMGITRLSLGVENFKKEILQFNGRAHLEEEIYRAYGWARELQFPQINIDLIAGMVGEDWENWRRNVQKTLELAPDTVTVYQMELPYNTVFSKEFRIIGQDEPVGAVADWPTKRAWVAYAFEEFEKAGYIVTSATTAMKNSQTQFVYRDALWSGADMFGTGVASFGHIHGVHMQNVDTWEAYIEKLNRDEIPLGRAYTLSAQELFARETILLLKKGYLKRDYFLKKYGKDIMVEFAPQFQELKGMGFLSTTAEGVQLNREGLIQIDRHLPLFFESQYRGTRYT